MIERVTLSKHSWIEFVKSVDGGTRRSTELKEDSGAIADEGEALDGAGGSCALAHRCGDHHTATANVIAGDTCVVAAIFERKGLW